MVYAPVVDEYVEDAQERNEEARTVFRLEPDGDHDASAEADDGDEDAGKRPIALENEADEEEDEEDPAGELEAAMCQQLLDG
jgi:hypothetical protein